MNIWLVLPVKPFSQGKSRLSTVLTEHARVTLNRALMIHVLDTAIACQRLAGVVVVSRDPKALEIARSYAAQGHAVHDLEERGQELNNALCQGRSYAVRNHADALLVLPIDLPLLKINDLHLIFQKGGIQDAMVIAPSPDGGTNALLLRPPDAVPFHFGRNSFEQHYASAHSANLKIHTVYSPGLQTDIDLPQDLLQLPPSLLAMF